MDSYDSLFVLTSFLIQISLLLYFALRKWDFERAMAWGWIVYALALPAVIVSVVLLNGGKPWYLWLAGFLYTAWAIVGYVADIARPVEWRPVEWRSPILWPVFIPYVLLYLASQMFYWWPLATIWKPLWYVYAVLFLISTLLNLTSHTSNPHHPHNPHKDQLDYK